ncbi:hypothetical protein SOCEGT47_072190 [Sorangium cellulosum]|jgi:hypothetical protein|uniref:Secreted protein n=1 Tax=Sorangium cellulosum TaxID=56 RepID=A0A4P2QAN4_SORCE|nr:hypothetical protein [Sorangium cellulosum]AUX26649.1 hypothetical protein SOCEGT47_072190 [Sorangium cellulosum]
MRPYGALSSTCLLLAGAALVGCSAPVAGDTADASGAITQGVVLVERAINLSRDAALTAPALESEDAAPGAAAVAGSVTNVSAKFMRLSSATDPELAERLVGSPFDLPSAGSCMVLSPAAGDEATSLSSLGSIELLDAGDVTMKTDSTEMPLAARAFPDVGDLVFGVFYTSRDATSDLPAPARYAFESSGSGMLDRFAFEADAPAGPEEVRIGDVDLADGVELDAGVSAIVQWRADEDGGAGRARDIVYVDVTSARGTAVRCAFRDTGRGVIPGSLLDPSTLGPLPASATLAVHRTRQVPFSASGIDLGEVRFDLSVIGRARVVAR